MLNHHEIKAARMIKLFSALFALIMICAFIPAASAAAPLTISVGSTSATAGGENVEINITLANVAANLPRGINNSGFTIQYDNTVLDIVSVARGSLVTNAVDMAVNPSTAAEINANNGRIVLLHNDDSAGQRPIKRDGIYAVITFKAKSGAASGNYPVTFKTGASSIGQMNIAGTYPEDINLAPVLLNAGAITVEGSNPIIVSSTGGSSSTANQNSSTNTSQTPAPNEPFITPAANQFKDTEAHWANANIQKLVDLKILSGYSDGTFLPDKNISRAEFAAVLVRAMNYSLSQDIQLKFTDKDNIPAWAKSYVSAAVKAGIIHGYQDGTFRADDYISRVEMAVMVMRALAINTEPGPSLNFTDQAQIPEWAAQYVSGAVQKGIITGNPDNKFLPENKATRAEAATMTLKMLESIPK